MREKSFNISYYKILNWKTFLKFLSQLKKQTFYLYTIFLILVEVRKNFSKRKVTEEVNLIYDLYETPTTYGDLYMFLFLCRYFLSVGYKVNFFFIIDLKTNFSNTKSDKDKLEFIISDMKNLVIELLDHKNSSIFFYSWEKFIKNYNHLHKNKITLFEKRVLKRKRIFNFSFKMLNYFILNTSENNKRDILLDKEFKKHYKKNIDFDFKKNYITWGLRFNKFCAQERNNTEEELIETYKLLKKYLPDKDIVIISDVNGTNHFKKISEKYNLSLTFSKDFTNSFIEDVLLILNSDFHYQFKGGGTSSVAIFSNVNYIIFAPRTYEKLSLTNKFCFWQTKKQIFKKIRHKTRFNKYKLEFELKKMFLKNNL
mgnify:CR=1 FL=1